MPPATLQLHDLDFDAAQVTIKGSPTQLYVGYIQITARINGEEKHFQYGSKDKPIRWMGNADDIFKSDVLDNVLDWDVRDHRWKSWRELNPYLENESTPPVASDRRPSQDGSGAKIITSSGGEPCQQTGRLSAYGNYPRPDASSGNRRRVWLLTKNLR